MTEDMFSPGKVTQETPRHTLHRKDAPATSVAAAHRVDVTKREQEIYDLIFAAGKRGVTIKELASDHPEIPYPTISARPGGLEKKGLIYYAGDKREGARVMRAMEHQVRLLFCDKCMGVLFKVDDYECKSPRCK